MESLIVDTHEARIEQMVEAAATGIADNTITIELEKLVQWTALVGEQSMNIMQLAINGRLTELNSQYRLELALSSTSDGEVKSGFVLIMLDNKQVTKALIVSQRRLSSGNHPSTAKLPN